MPTTHEVRTEHGDRVTYDLHGTPAGGRPAVVFVAGAGPYRAIDAATTACAEGLAERGLVGVVHDRLGRGESMVDGVIDLDREVAAVRALAAGVGDSVVLCGHSSGCAIALYAATHSVPAVGLALWEAPMDPDTPGVDGWTRRTEDLLDAGDLEGAVTHYLKDLPPELVDGLRDSPVWPAFVAHAPALRADAQALRWAYSGEYADLFGRELGDAGVRVRAVYGHETFPEMPRAAAAIATAVAGGVSGAIAGAQHTWDADAMADVLAQMCRHV